MSGTHARLAPSAAHRWMECPGAPDLEARIPEGGMPSIYADEGTMQHNVVAERLPHVRATRKTSFADLIGKEIQGESRTFTFTVEHANACQSCAEWAIESGIAAPRTIAFIEQRVYVPGRNDLYGTVDYGLVDRPLRVLRVTDWKFGLGVKVFARENPQLIIYALGILFMLEGIEDIERVQIIVHQPHLDHHDVWEISADELRGYLRRILDAAAATDGAGETYRDGDWCLFCNAKPVCPALRATALALAKSDFAAVASLSDDALGQAMLQVPRVEAFIRAIEAETFVRMERGGKVPGFKLGEGRRSQSYVSESNAIARAALDGVHPFAPAKVLTPAQMREAYKAAGEKFPDSLVTWSKGKLKVIPEDDERAALTSAQLDFQPMGHDDL